MHRSPPIALVAGLVATAWTALCGAQETVTDDGTDDGPIDLTTTAAPAPEPEPEDTSWLDAPAERRSGFTFGLMGGALVGGGSGWPADALVVGRDDFQNSTGFAGGGQGVGYFGVALADWMMVGLGAGGGALVSADTRSTFVAFGFRLDAFPAFGLGGVWRDLGLMVDAGLGVGETVALDTEQSLIESGVASSLRVGVFYEGIQLWKVSMGPFAAVDGMFSPTMDRAAAFLGWRSTIYAGP